MLSDLVDARKVKKLQAQIEESAETVRTLLGHYYHKSKTDFQGAEKALELTAEIRKLNWATTIPENLLKLITNTSSPSPMIKNLGLELQESAEKWEQQLKDYHPSYHQAFPNRQPSYLETPLPLLEEWASETEKQLSPLCELTNQTLATSKAGTPKLQAAVGRPQKRRRHSQERSRHRSGKKRSFKKNSVHASMNLKQTGKTSSAF